MRASTSRLVLPLGVSIVALALATGGGSPNFSGPGGVAAAAAPAIKAVAKSGQPNRKLFGVVPVGALSYSSYERMSRLGVGTARQTFTWAAVEPQRGVRDWSVLDDQVGAATAAGVRILPMLFGVPEWVSKDPWAPPLGSSEAREGWRRFVADAARRYGRDGIFWTLHPEIPERPLTIWQVWNEPNLPYYFGYKVGVRRYRDLLRMTARTLRRVDPKVDVATAGLFRYKTIPGSTSMLAFLGRLYQLKGIKKWFDVLALHPYSPRPGGLITAIAEARKLMRRERDLRTPVWLTEFGWTTGGEGWRRNAFRSTKRQQARRLTKTFRLLIRHKELKVRRAFWNTYNDYEMPGADDWTARMGLIDLNGVRRPSWYAYARIAGGQP